MNASNPLPLPWEGALEPKASKVGALEPKASKVGALEPKASKVVVEGAGGAGASSKEKRSTVGVGFAGAEVLLAGGAGAALPSA